MSIAENVAKVRAEIAAAAIACGRDPREILLCAATKMNDAAAVREAIRAGVDCCGENRVQELTAKLAENAYEGAPVHFIGHLQTNKVAKAQAGREITEDDLLPQLVTPPHRLADEPALHVLEVLLAGDPVGMRVAVSTEGVDDQNVSRLAATKAASSRGRFPSSSDTRYTLAPCLILK